MDSLLLLSPLDGRYAEATSPLRDYFSEFSYLRDRVRVELDLLVGLSRIGLIRPVGESESELLESIW